MKEVVYHGSPNGELEVIQAHLSTHQKKCIYATDKKVVALLFMGKGDGDLDEEIVCVNGQLELVERRPNILNTLYNKEGYLYELDDSSFSHYDYLWLQEVISFEKELKPLRKIHYPNILKALEEEEKQGNLIIYRYPNRPQNTPLDNSDLIEKYIAFEKQGIHGSIAKLLKIYPEFQEIVEEKLEIDYDFKNIRKR